MTVTIQAKHWNLDRNIIQKCSFHSIFLSKSDQFKNKIYLDLFDGIVTPDDFPANFHF